MPIRTVEELVESLRKEGVTFSVLSNGVIRTSDRTDAAGSPCCPLMAAAPRALRLVRTNSYADCAAIEYGMPPSLTSAVIAAADDCHGHDPAIRAQLLTLVQ